jgi:hypothetical protein
MRTATPLLAPTCRLPLPDQSYVVNQMLVELQRIRKEVRQLGWLVAIVLAWLVYNTLSH